MEPILVDVQVLWALVLDHRKDPAIVFLRNDLIVPVVLTLVVFVLVGAALVVAVSPVIAVVALNGCRRHSDGRLRSRGPRATRRSRSKTTNRVPSVALAAFLVVVALPALTALVAPLAAVAALTLELRRVVLGVGTLAAPFRVTLVAVPLELALVVVLFPPLKLWPLLLPFLLLPPF